MFEKIKHEIFVLGGKHVKIPYCFTCKIIHDVPMKKLKEQALKTGGINYYENIPNRPSAVRILRKPKVVKCRRKRK